MLVSLLITMEVIQAIRKLLFLEDCVIIPGLGGFVSQYRPAVIDKATNTFIPPAKEIVFNNELLQNDGILVSFIEKQDNIPSALAREQVDFFVDETRKQLELGKDVAIPGVGHFHLDAARAVSFLSDAGTNLFLDSFGLAPVHLRDLPHELKPAVSKVLTTTREESPRTIEFAVEEIKKSRGHANLRRIAIAMPLLIAFSLLPYNSRVTDTLTSSRASLIPEPSLYRLNYPEMPSRDTARVIEFPVADSAIVPASTVASELLVTDSVKAEVKADIKPEAKPEVKPETKVEVKPEIKAEVKPEAIKPAAVPAASGQYPVIAGCFKIKENAERLHKELVGKGYPAEIVPTKNGLMFKVRMQTFATRKEAIEGLARLKKAEPEMQLWVAL